MMEYDSDMQIKRNVEYVYKKRNLSECEDVKLWFNPNPVTIWNSLLEPEQQYTEMNKTNSSKIILTI